MTFIISQFLGEKYKPNLVLSVLQMDNLYDVSAFLMKIDSNRILFLTGIVVVGSAGNNADDGCSYSPSGSAVVGCKQTKTSLNKKQKSCYHFTWPRYTKR